MKKIITLFFVLSFFLIPLSMIKTDAIESEYHTEPLSESELKSLIDNINLQFIEEDLHLPYISCFDINNNGEIAIGADPFLLIPNDLIAVYDSAGNFQYGYRFNDDQTSYAIWTNNVLNLYLLRSGVLLSLDDNGNCLSGQSVVYDDHNQGIDQYLMYLRSIEHNGYRYTVDFGNAILPIIYTDYSRVVRVDAQGRKETLIDCSLLNDIISICRVLIAVAFVLAAIFGAYKVYLKNAKAIKSEVIPNNDN